MLLVGRIRKKLGFGFRKAIEYCKFDLLGHIISNVENSSAHSNVVVEF